MARPPEDSWYTVWRRRPDGHVGATRGKRLPYAPRGDGRSLLTASFTELLVTDGWPAARALIQAERAAAELFGDTWYCYEKQPCFPAAPHDGFCGWRFAAEVTLLRR